MDDLSKIPNELLFNVASFLSPQEFAALCATCTRVRNLLRDAHFLWQNGELDSNMAVQDVLSGCNVFITGPAGSGKSHTIKRIYDSLTKNVGCDTVAMTSTTLASATMLPDGSTVHHIAGISMDDDKITTNDFRRHLFARKNTPYMKALRDRWEPIRVLIIDEVSMLGRRTLELLNVAAQVFKRCYNKPMGGVQVVACGDFCQLPPVNDPAFAFQSNVWTELNFKNVELSVSMRHITDYRFFSLLQRVRVGKPSPDDIIVLEEHLKKTSPLTKDTRKNKVIPTWLFPRNVDVCNRNMSMLKALGKSERTFSAEDIVVRRNVSVDNYGQRHIHYTQVTNDMERGLGTLTALQNKLDARIPSTLSLVVGGQYVVTRNAIDTSMDGARPLRIYNGMQCVYKGNMRMDYLVSDGSYVEGSVPEMCVFYTPIRGDIYLQRIQIPLKVGYALSIHASQGMTLDCAAVDIGSRIFSSGQLYVALSRVKTLEGLHLLAFDKSKICMSELVAKFYGYDNPKKRKLQDNDTNSKCKKTMTLDMFTI